MFYETCCIRSLFSNLFSTFFRISLVQSLDFFRDVFSCETIKLISTSFFFHPVVVKCIKVSVATKQNSSKTNKSRPLKNSIPWELEREQSSMYQVCRTRNKKKLGMYSTKMKIDDLVQLPRQFGACFVRSVQLIFDVFDFFWQ